MLLHLLIAITPEPFNVSEYSIVCIVRMYFLLPDATTQALADWSGAAFSTKLAILGVALASGALNLNPLGVIGTPIYVWLFMLFCRALYLDATMPPLTTTAPPPAPTKRYLKWHPQLTKSDTPKRLLSLKSLPQSTVPESSRKASPKKIYQRDPK